MHLETRLARLEARYAATDRQPIRIVRLIIDPDPAIGVVGIVAREPNGALRSFERQAGESVDELRARVEGAMGW